MRLSQLVQILGGQKVLRREIATRLDLVALGQKGVPKAALLQLTEFLGLSVAQIAALLPVTERTIQRYPMNKNFSRVVSEQIIQLAEVAARGVEVFADRESFLAWLDAPNPALQGHTPRSLLASRFGSELVLDELGRIEHGVFA